MTKIRVIVAEDQAMVLGALAALLETEPTSPFAGEPPMGAKR